MHIVRLIDAFAEARNLAPTSVSVYCAGQAHLVNRLRAGKNITYQRAQKIVQWLSDNWPEDARWPLEIPRPAPTPGSPAAPNDDAVPLNDRGHVIDPHDIVDPICQILDYDCTEAIKAGIHIYHGVCRDYADTGKFKKKKPRPGTTTRKIFDALIAAGDTRFQRRIDLDRKLAEILGKAS